MIVTLQWNAVPGAARYNLYCSATAGYWTSVWDVGTQHSGSFTVPNGSTFFAATSVDAAGVEGPFSNVKQITGVTPAAPTNLRIVT